MSQFDRRYLASRGGRTRSSTFRIGDRKGSALAGADPLSRSCIRKIAGSCDHEYIVGIGLLQKPAIHQNATLVSSEQVGAPANRRTDLNRAIADQARYPHHSLVFAHFPLIEFGDPDFAHCRGLQHDHVLNFDPVAFRQ